MRWILIVLISITAAAWAGEDGASVADYKAYLEGLDQTDVESFGKASDYFRDNMAFAPIEVCDEAARAFIAFFEGAVGRMKGFDAMPKIASYVQRDNGVEIDGTFDGWSCAVSPAAAATLFAPFIARCSTEIADYLALPPLPLMFWGEYGGSTLSFRMRAEHVGARERFLQRYPESPYAAEVARLLMVFRYTLLVDDYIAAFECVEDTDPGKLRIPALDAYRWYVRTYPDTPTATSLRAYLDILAANGYRFSPPVYAFLESCDTDEARDWLPGEYEDAEAYLHFEGAPIQWSDADRAQAEASNLGLAEKERYGFGWYMHLSHEERRGTP
jgi:hypothetical protein